MLNRDNGVHLPCLHSLPQALTAVSFTSNGPLDWHLGLNCPHATAFEEPCIQNGPRTGVCLTGKCLAYLIRVPTSHKLTRNIIRLNSANLGVVPGGRPTPPAFAATATC